MKFLKSFVEGKLVWGDLLSGKIIRRGKFSLGKIIRHLTKISSLFPDELFPDKVNNKGTLIFFLLMIQGLISDRIIFDGPLTTPVIAGAALY